MSTYHGLARYQTEAGVAAAMAYHASFQRSPESTRALGLLTKWGDVPATPPVQPLDNRSPGIAQEDDDPRKKPLDGGSNKKPAEQPPTDPMGTPATQPGTGPAVQAGAGNEGINTGWPDHAGAACGGHSASGFAAGRWCAVDVWYGRGRRGRDAENAGRLGRRRYAGFILESAYRAW